MSTSAAMPTLAVEMIPEPVWGSNLRKLAPDTWQIVRARARAQATRCAFCAGPPAHCHERWEYEEHDAQDGTQVLGAVVMIGERCHEVIHLGRTGKVLGPDAFARALAHLGTVNGWTTEQVEAHVAEAQRTWERRSTMRWGLDLAPVVEQYGLSADDLRGWPVSMNAIVRHESTGSGLPPGTVGPCGIGR